MLSIPLCSQSVMSHLGRSLLKDTPNLIDNFLPIFLLRATRPSPTSWSTSRTVPTPAPPLQVHDVESSGVPATSLPSCCVKSKIAASTRMQRTIFISAKGSRNCEIGHCYEIPPPSDQCDGTFLPHECCFGIDGESLSPDYCANVNGYPDDLRYFVREEIPTLQPYPHPSHHASFSIISSLIVVLSDILTITPFDIFHQTQH